MRPILDDPSEPHPFPREARADRATVAIAILAVVTIITNAFLLVLAGGGPHDWGGGWADLGVVVFLGPVANFLLFVAAIALAPWAVADYESERSYILASIGLPFAAYAIDFAVIVSGCFR